MNFLQSLLNIGHNVGHAAETVAHAVTNSPAPSQPLPSHTNAVQTLLGTGPSVTVGGHQFNYATPDVNVGPAAPYSPLNRGISFNGAPSGLPNPSRGGMPLLNANLGQSNWQFNSNSPNSHAPGIIQSDQGVTLPYGGTPNTVDSSMTQPNLFHPAIATPAYYQPQQPPRMSV